MEFPNKYTDVGDGEEGGVNILTPTNPRKTKTTKTPHYTYSKFDYVFHSHQ